MPADVPSLLGLPLRLDEELLIDDVWFAAPLLIVALERIHPPSFVRPAEAVCDPLVPCMTQPVTVIRCELFAAERVVDVLVRDVPRRF